MERAASGIGLYMKPDKTEFMCIKQDGTISTLNKTVKLVDRFIYFGSNISCNESEVNILIEKSWTTIDWLVTK